MSVTIIKSCHKSEHVRHVRYNYFFLSANKSYRYYNYCRDNRWFCYADGQTDHKRFSAAFTIHTPDGYGTGTRAIYY